MADLEQMCCCPLVLSPLRESYAFAALWACQSQPHPISLCFSASLTRLKTLGQELSFVLVHIVPGIEWGLKKYLITKRLQDRSEGVSWYLGLQMW